MGDENDICLNMIVKNESHIIEKTLLNLCDYINFSYWVICDTGSEDSTVDIIKNFFNKKNIPGEIYHHEWKNFGHNRTLALEAAFNKTDYLLIFDADDCIVGDLKVPKLTNDSYRLFFGTDNFKYIRNVIINNRKKWKFKGILHEFLISLEKNNSDKIIEGDYFIKSGKEGSRSKNLNKYLDDAILLKSRIDLLESPNNEDYEDRDLIPRYTFYCANSFKDYCDIDNAILYYKKVLDFDTWHQEKYISALNIGDLYEKLNNMEEALTYWYRAIIYDKERRESISKIMNYYYKSNNWYGIYCLHESIKEYEIKNVSSKLFLTISVTYDNHYFNSIACANIFEWMSGYHSCKFLLLKDLHVEITLQNFQCYSCNVHLDPDNRLFLEKLLILFKKYFNTKKTIVLKLWNDISEHFKTVFNLDDISQLISTGEMSILKTNDNIDFKIDSNVNTKKTNTLTIKPDLDLD